MANIFISQIGKISVFSLPGAQSLYLGEIVSPNNLYPSNSVIITDIATNSQTNTGFQHSLQHAIYMYGFGERLSEIQVSGLTFTANCAPSVSINGMGGASGIGNVFAYYKQNKLSNIQNNNIPIIEIQFGTQVIHGLLIGLNTSVADPNNLSSRFTLMIKGELL